MANVGLLNLNKPTGMTSRAVVTRVARLLGQKKAGHAGTLDPLATGVLVICLGWATRLIEYVQGDTKRYRATFLLGQSSPSNDCETEITRHDALPRPTLAEIAARLPRFIGAITQRPPIYSALKINGKRAYKLARKGRDVELEPRLVTIYGLQLVRYAFPELVLDVECGQGTYIRSLGRDLAQTLGTVALMSALERTAIGSFTVAEACPWSEVESGSLDRWVLPPRRAVEELPTLLVGESERDTIALGRAIVAPPQLDAAPEYAALDPRGALIGILAPGEPGRLRVVRNFALG